MRLLDSSSDFTTHRDYVKELTLCYTSRLDWIVQCFTSPLTQYRLYGRRFLQVKRPNQQYQSTEGKSTKENNPQNKKSQQHNKNSGRTLLIMTLAAFQLRSFGIFLVLLASSIMTAPVTDMTAVGGLANDFISVRLF